MGNFNKLILHPSFNKTISEISRLNIQIPPIPTAEEMDFNPYTYPPNNGKLVSTVEDFKNYKLNQKNGEELVDNGIQISAYDESINKFSGLEGTAYLMSHSFVIHGGDDYLSSNLLAFYFYTRSEAYTKKSSFIKYSENPERDSKENYVTDRTNFMLDNTPNNSVLFIDGPLIGGQISDYSVRLNEELLKRNVVPIFFVKNSASNLVTDHTKELRGKYNSDMHWAYKTLKLGERTNFFTYEDQYNTRNAKLFCYLKALDVSPQRVEFHVRTFEKYKTSLSGLMDLVYYLMLLQGDPTNPQIRPIAIAEKYARSTLKLIEVDKLMKQLGIISTINQERFGWG